MKMGLLQLSLIKQARPEKMVVKSLATKKRGILGSSQLQDIIVSLRRRGTPIGIGIGIGRGLLLKHNRSSMNEFGGDIILGKEWAKSILRRMGFSKRRANSKSKVLE